MDQLYDRTVNSIKKIKTIDSEEWDIIGNYIFSIKRNIERVINDNQRILEYYESQDFLKIKETCEALMSSQKEFNEYIAEKVHSISQLFGTRVVRNETVHNDIYNYIRLYKKTITPFTAEVSKAVFASAENNPLEYVVKYFYPDKALYPKQIQGLSKLIEELETVRESLHTRNLPHAHPAIKVLVPFGKFLQVFFHFDHLWSLRMQLALPPAGLYGKSRFIP